MKFELYSTAETYFFRFFVYGCHKGQISACDFISRFLRKWGVKCTCKDFLKHFQVFIIDKFAIKQLVDKN